MSFCESAIEANENTHMAVAEQVSRWNELARLGQNGKEGVTVQKQRRRGSGNDDLY